MSEAIERVDLSIVHRDIGRIVPSRLSEDGAATPGVLSLRGGLLDVGFSSAVRPLAFSHLQLWPFPVDSSDRLGGTDVRDVGGESLSEISAETAAVTTTVETAESTAAAEGADRDGEPTVGEIVRAAREPRSNDEPGARSAASDLPRRRSIDSRGLSADSESARSRGADPSDSTANPTSADTNAVVETMIRADIERRSSWPYRGPKASARDAPSQTGVDSDDGRGSERFPALDPIELRTADASTHAETPLETGRLRPTDPVSSGGFSDSASPGVSSDPVSPDAFSDPNVPSPGVEGRITERTPGPSTNVDGTSIGPTTDAGPPMTVQRDDPSNGGREAGATATGRTLATTAGTDPGVPDNVSLDTPVGSTRPPTRASSESHSSGRGRTSPPVEGESRGSKAADLEAALDIPRLADRLYRELRRKRRIERERRGRR